MADCIKRDVEQEWRPTMEPFVFRKTTYRRIYFGSVSEVHSHLAQILLGVHMGRFNTTGVSRW